MATWTPEAKSNTSVATAYLLIDDTYFFLIDDTYKLIIQEGSTIEWTNENKS